MAYSFRFNKSAPYSRRTHVDERERRYKHRSSQNTSQSLDNYGSTADNEWSGRHSYTNNRYSSDCENHGRHNYATTSDRNSYKSNYASTSDNASRRNEYSSSSRRYGRDKYSSNSDTNLYERQRPTYNESYRSKAYEENYSNTNNRTPIADNEMHEIYFGNSTVENELIQTEHESNKDVHTSENSTSTKAEFNSNSDMHLKQNSFSDGLNGNNNAADENEKIAGCNAREITDGCENQQGEHNSEPIVNQADNYSEGTNNCVINIKQEIKQELNTSSCESPENPNEGLVENIRITNIKTLSEQDNVSTNNEFNQGHVPHHSESTAISNNDENYLALENESTLTNTSNEMFNQYVMGRNNDLININNAESVSTESNEELNVSTRGQTKEIPSSLANTECDNTESANTECDNDEIFVTNLCKSTTVLLLAHLFQKYGHVLDIKFIKTTAVKSACIRFEESKSAKTALIENGRIFNGRHLVVNLFGGKCSYPHTVNIFNVSSEVDQEDLWRVFECCGKIVRTYINRKPCYSDLSGTVSFQSAKSVKLALKMKTFLYGRLLVVRKCLNSKRNIDKRKKDKTK